MYNNLTESELVREQERLEYEYEALERGNTAPEMLKGLRADLDKIAQRLAELRVDRP